MASQRDIAARLGLTQAAVSLALNGSPRISAATRARVQEEARRLGWRADPVLTALSRRRWSGEVGAIAFLGSPVQGEDARFDRYWTALRAAARVRGLAIHRVDPRRRRDAAGLAAELARLGVIHGAVIGQDTRGLGPWAIDHARFAVVHCGLYAAPGPGDAVCADLLAAPAAAVARLAPRGRIAAILTVAPHALSEQMLATALHALAAAGAVTLWTGPHDDLERAVAWLRRQDAAVVLGYGDAMADALPRLGVRLPFAGLAVGEDRRIAGCCIPYAAIAQRALDVLLERIAGGGRDGGRRIHLVPMPWRD